MKVIYRTLLLLPALFFSLNIAYSQSTIGSVRVSEILTEMPEYKTVLSQVEAAQKAYQDTILGAQESLQQEVTKFQQEQGVLSPEDKAAQEQRLQQRYQGILQYQETHLGPTGTVAQYNQALLRPLEEKVLNAIRAIAQQKQLTAVLNEQGTLYVDQSIDITLDVQLYLKNNK